MGNDLKIYSQTKFEWSSDILVGVYVGVVNISHRSSRGQVTHNFHQTADPERGKVAGSVKGKMKYYIFRGRQTAKILKWIYMITVYGFICRS